MKRFYRDLGRLRGFAQSYSFFVTRCKANLKFYVIDSRWTDTSKGLRCNQTTLLSDLGLS